MAFTISWPYDFPKIAKEFENKINLDQDTILGLRIPSRASQGHSLNLSFKTRWIITIHDFLSLHQNIVMAPFSPVCGG
jgi:hypothetical protein